MILFLKPYFESRVWAGSTLSKIYDCKIDTGEAWIASGIRNKASIIANGPFKGENLYDFYQKHKELFKINDDEFPILIKILDASSDLSIQVHPDNQYAKKRHNKYGKFECWYFLDKNQAKEVVVGVDAKNIDELKTIIDGKELGNHLTKANIYPHSFMPIEPGTVHALQGGTYVLEVQQPSDVTYRLYDYDRLPLRELHIEDSLNVINLDNKVNISDFSLDNSYSNKYFKWEKKTINSDTTIQNNTFFLAYIEKGNGYINDNLVEENDIVLVLDSDLEAKGNMTIILSSPNN